MYQHHLLLFTTHHVLLIAGPLLEDLQRLTGVQHTWCGEHHLKSVHIVNPAACLHMGTVRRGACTHHGPGVVSVGPVEGLDVLKLKHVPLHEGLSNLLVGPRDEKLVVVIRFLRQPGGEVDRRLQVHSLPVWQDELIKVVSPASRPPLFCQAS